MSAIKMDELLVSWLGNDDVYENVLELIENYRISASTSPAEDEKKEDAAAAVTNNNTEDNSASNTTTENTASVAVSSEVVIPPFYPIQVGKSIRKKRHVRIHQKDSWDPLPAELTQPQQYILHQQTSKSTTTAAAPGETTPSSSSSLLLPQLARKHTHTHTTSDADPSENTDASGADPPDDSENHDAASTICIRDQATAIFQELGTLEETTPTNNTTTTNTDDPQDWTLAPEHFVRVTKDLCGFPSFFNQALYTRILFLYNQNHHDTQSPQSIISLSIFEWYWKAYMEPYDACDRFFQLLKQPDADAIVRDDFLPLIKALLQDHPGLEFLSTHAEFQEKYAVTVITRIFYTVNKCHSGRISSRQLRLSDLVDAFIQVDEEEDINKVTRYFSYEHFYVLYCRFWELDHDRDYRITREDLLKYGDQSLSHMIVDRIFDAAPRPFEQPPASEDGRDYLSYEDFIYFMLSEEDKANPISVHYWFTCVDVDGDGKLNNMEMRSFYAVQLHRMQFMGHEIVPFEDMLCQMMDMIKPQHAEYLVETDFLQPECRQVAGALFDALFNLNKYLLFEQRDPFVERQKREDEFECDWDRFACLDYSRLAMEEEAREEEAMEIDWVNVDEDEEQSDEDSAGTDDDSESDLQGASMLQQQGSGSSEAPF